MGLDYLSEWFPRGNRLILFLLSSISWLFSLSLFTLHLSTPLSLSQNTRHRRDNLPSHSVLYPPCHSTSVLSSIQLSLVISFQRKLDDLFTRNIYPFHPCFSSYSSHHQMNDSSLEGEIKWGSATPKWKELNCNMIDTIKSVQVSSFLPNGEKRERESSHHILLIVFFSLLLFYPVCGWLRDLVYTVREVVRWPINRNVSSLQFNPRPKGRIEKQIEEKVESDTLEWQPHGRCALKRRNTVKGKRVETRRP